MGCCQSQPGTKEDHECRFEAVKRISSSSGEKAAAGLPKAVKPAQPEIDTIRTEVTADEGVVAEPAKESAVEDVAYAEQPCKPASNDGTSGTATGDASVSGAQFVDSTGDIDIKPVCEQAITDVSVPEVAFEQPAAPVADNADTAHADCAAVTDVEIEATSDTPAATDNAEQVAATPEVADASQAAEQPEEGEKAEIVTPLPISVAAKVQALQEKASLSPRALPSPTKAAALAAIAVTSKVKAAKPTTHATAEPAVAVDEDAADVTVEQPTASADSVTEPAIKTEPVAETAVADKEEGNLTVVEESDNAVVENQEIVVEVINEAKAEIEPAGVPDAAPVIPAPDAAVADAPAADVVEPVSDAAPEDAAPAVEQNGSADEVVVVTEGVENVVVKTIATDNVVEFEQVPVTPETGNVVTDATPEIESIVEAAIEETTPAIDAATPAADVVQPIPADEHASDTSRTTPQNKERTSAIARNSRPSYAAGSRSSAGSKAGERSSATDKTHERSSAHGKTPDRTSVGSKERPSAGRGHASGKHTADPNAGVSPEPKEGHAVKRTSNPHSSKQKKWAL